MGALDIVIVGGGIGGLAAAIALRDSGHRVTVLEQAPQHSEVGAAVGLGPNATAALFELGIADRLGTSAVAPAAWTRRRWNDGTVIGAIPLAGEVLREFGYPFWMSHRVHLHQALLERASAHRDDAPAVRIELSVRVTEVEAASGTVRTNDGAIHTGDLIVGADGIRSRVRNAIAPDESAVFSGNIAVRAQIDSARVLAVEELRSFVTDNRLETWMGPGGHIVTSIIQAGQLLNITACFEAPPSGTESWYSQAGTALMTELVSEWYPPLQRLIGLAGSIGHWDLYDRDPIEQWVCDRVVLLGDAAHPMLPYLGQGAAQTLEDAVVLGRSLAGLDVDGVPAALGRYASIRIPRAHEVQRRSRDNRDILHMPDGPKQQARDEAFRQGGGDFDVLRWLWTPTFSDVSGSGGTDE